jgi:hypothetical protein
MKKYINNLEESKEYYMGLVVEFQNTFYDNTDYFFFMSSAINRAMNINRGFITLTKDDNYSCAIPLMRLMIDNCMRFWGITLVDDKHEYIKVWGSGERISSIKDRNGYKLSDKHLSECFALLYRGVDKTYNDACAFVHFSEQNLYITAKVDKQKERRVDLRIDGYDHFPETTKNNIDKWMLYLNNVLIDTIRAISQTFLTDMAYYK